MRWFDSEYYTSINTVDYVKTLMKQKTRPTFYKFLIYELIETQYSFKDLTLKLPFDKNYNRISCTKLHKLELKKLKYHFKELKKYYINHPHLGTN